MTVGELIERLKELPPDAVIVSVDYPYNPAEVDVSWAALRNNDGVHDVTLPNIVMIEVN